jgi:hypothetical protein
VGAINYQPTDVILMGNGETLLWKSNPDIVPGPSWMSVNLDFVPSTEWHVGTSNGALATAADFGNVLANLSGLFIRCEYTTGLIETPGPGQRHARWRVGPCPRAEAPDDDGHRVWHGHDVSAKPPKSSPES